jgi:CDP-diacylglycerol---serine O-phosphatidyltransferase
LISMIIAFEAARGGALPSEARWPVLGIVVFLALLMVSTVRYRTFKGVKPSPRSAIILLGVIVTGVAVGVMSHPAWVLVTYFGLYLLSGLVESTLLLRKYLMEKHAPASSIADVIDEDEDADEKEDDAVEDQEVL